MYIATLAKQMYPHNSQYLIDHFKEATIKPYGYLLIDLKPTTPEDKRLRSNIIQNNKTIQPIVLGAEKMQPHEIIETPDQLNHTHSMSLIQPGRIMKA